MGDTVTTMRFYEQIKREKRAKEKWNQKYLTAEQLELERQAEAAAIAEHAERTKPKKKLNERDAMLARLHAVELRPSTPEDADEEMEAEQGGAARKESTQRTYRMTAHQLARERIRQEVAATRERSCKMSHDLSLESQLNDISPLLWAKFNAGARVPASAPSSRAARLPAPLQPPPPSPRRVQAPARLSGDAHRPLDAAHDAHLQRERRGRRQVVGAHREAAQPQHGRLHEARREGGRPRREAVRADGAGRGDPPEGSRREIWAILEQ